MIATDTFIEKGQKEIESDKSDSTAARCTDDNYFCSIVTGQSLGRQNTTSVAGTMPPGVAEADEKSEITMESDSQLKSDDRLKFALRE